MTVRSPHIEAYCSRERCHWCKEYSAIGFHVPDDIWAQVVPQRVREAISCIRCFARMADERLVRWEKDIDFYPVSLRSHMDNLPHLEGESND